VQRTIGRGGMANVYEADDAATSSRVALKRLVLRGDPKQDRRLQESFEREFYLLSQLAHPRIVEVYDYVADDDGHYYTMELLDGGDLQGFLHADWRKGCALIRDVCSALSLVHSRGLVHRDVSVRNVRCTSDGFAKLIDFGAVVPRGPNRYPLVATPAYAAPEVVRREPLDPRADLFALGATLYYTLTGHHAYPAPSFAALLETWKTPPRPPSAYANDVPPALDELVLELLTLDRDARPANAAEVMERLGVIEGCAIDEQLVVAQAYLSTPRLVGRERPLRRVRKESLKAIRGRGRAVLIEGAPGVGRSRFLDAVALDAKLQGGLVLTADPDDARDGPYGVIRALARQMIDEAPEVSIDLARSRIGLLGHAIPELLARVPEASLDAITDSGLLRAALFPALREWFLARAGTRSLVFAVDDFHRIDEPSAAVIALLSQEIRTANVAIVATAELDDGVAPSGPRKLLAETAERVVLEPLELHDTAALLASVFGEVPNLELLAHRLQTISRGNPRDVMRLSQDLLERKIVRYRAGAWLLPATLDDVALPSSMAAALKLRFDHLEPDAREFAVASSLCSDRAHSFDECLLLTEHRNGRRLFATLDELVREDLVRTVGERFVFSERSWLPVLREFASDELLRTLHLRVASLFETRDHEEFHVGMHLLYGGEASRAVEVLSHHAVVSLERERHNPDRFPEFVRTLPPDWLDVYERAISLAESLGRPALERYYLRYRLGGLLALTGKTAPMQVQALLSELCALTGLADFEASDPALDAGARLMTAISAASERYERSSDRDRVLDPGQGIVDLARAVSQTVGVAAVTIDVLLLDSLPSLAPFAPLSPSLGIIDDLVQAAKGRVTGRGEQARVSWHRVLDRTAASDRGGLDASHHRYMRLAVMNGLGIFEAGMGLVSSLQWAEKVGTDPTCVVNAIQIRMLNHLCQGNVRLADICRRDAELLRIQNDTRQWSQGSHLPQEVAAHAAADDLTRVKHVVEEIAVYGERFSGWLPVLEYGRAEVQRIRGDYAAALAHFDAGLSSIAPGKHQSWPCLAGGKLRVLLELDRVAEAVALGRALVEAGVAAGVGHAVSHVRLPLALAEAEAGDRAASVRSADLAIECLERLGITGIHLAVAYETRARVAIALGDRAAFLRFFALAEASYKNGDNPALAAKCEKLRLDGSRPASPANAKPGVSVSAAGDPELSTRLRECREPSERANTALSWLVNSTGASWGAIYLVEPSGVVLAARSGGVEPPSSIGVLATQYLSDEDAEGATMNDESSTEVWRWPSGAEGEYRPFLLARHGRNGAKLVGVAVLLCPHGVNLAAPLRRAAEVGQNLGPPEVAPRGHFATATVVAHRLR
jgi:hypothetical protein